MFYSIVPIFAIVVIVRSITIWILNKHLGCDVIKIRILADQNRILEGNIDIKPEI